MWAWRTWDSEYLSAQVLVNGVLAGMGLHSLETKYESIWGQGWGEARREWMGDSMGEEWV